MSRWRYVYLLFCTLCPLYIPAEGVAQEINQSQEVYLTFRHEGVINEYLTARYREDDNTFLLPHLELFRSLGLQAELNLADNSISGRFPVLGEYRIDYSDGRAEVAGKQIYFDADQFLVTEMDYFIHPDLLYRLFGLDFQIRFNQLSIHLESERTMPVVAQAERERQRERAGRAVVSPEPEYYTLRYTRERNTLMGGFLDYSLTANYTNSGDNYLLQSSLGGEVAGGGLQGTLSGNWSQQSSTLRSSGLRWRYGLRGQSLLTSVTIGQTSSRGLLPVAYTGIQLSNDPLEPRRFFDTYRYHGRTVPDSEVELYRNNLLLDFQQADEDGEYQFDFPLTYGTSRYNLRIYSPDGEVTERRSRIQIPFTFVPPGEVNYTLNAGRLDNPLPGTIERSLMARGRVSTGVTNWLTLSGGTEYFDTYHETPTFSAGLTGRVLQQYLVSFEVAEDLFYRTAASVIYPSGMSVSLNYDRYLRQGGIYNRSGNESRLRTNFFAPLQLGPIPLFFRLGANHEQRPTSSQTRYNLDLSTRIDRANLRISFRDTQFEHLNWTTTPSARLNSAVTYTFPHSRTTLTPFRGLYLRGQLSWLPHHSQIYDAELQVSRRIFGSGRVQVAGGRNLFGDYNFFRFNLSFDFNRIRTNTSARSTRGSESVTQSFRGSIGVDQVNKRMQLNNQQQVGGAALAVRLFVDHNGSGTYEEGDELLPNNAIRIERTGGSISHEDGISYITMLQPYRRYNLSINKSAFHNPMLIPVHERFSVVTDPNQFKIVDVPLYMSGIVEGQVLRKHETGTTPLPGARLTLRNVGEEGDFTDHTEELRTFSDGTFYAYEVPPGNYELEMDSKQLQILNMRAEPEILEFRVEPLAEGDLVGDLEIRLIPVEEETEGEADMDNESETGLLPEIPQGIPVRWLEGHSSDDLPVGELIEEECHFNLQTGPSRRAFDYTLKNERLTGLDLNIHYNETTDLYAVRTAESVPLPEAVQYAELHFDHLESEDLAILARCNSVEDELMLEPISFQIQLGAFHSRDNAKRLTEMLSDQFDVHTFIRHHETTGLHHVLTGPLHTAEAFDTADRLRKKEAIQDLFLIPSADSISAEMKFEAILQASRFDEFSYAKKCAGELFSRIQEPSLILIDSRDNYHIMLQRMFPDWQSLLELLKDIPCNGTLDRPLIHLVEKAATYR